MNIILAIVLGTLFGFVLQKAGAANPQKIINMLRLKDFHLMKAILLGIGLSSLLLFALLTLGWIPTAHLSVKSSYVGVIIGGLILGLGWAIAGYCPGTGVVAAGAGRRDALAFLFGGLLGALVYMLVYGYIADSFLFNSIAGGKTTLVDTHNESYHVLIENVSPMLVAGGIAVIFIIIAFLLPKSQGEDNAE
ncbi:YeeE/YedE family protein [Suttonella sp. R2A3]|uniref:DUF6691 family protein n=1 Tax=Suttonella sp. R2A3 TaxID=2908648 RepID=UPI001F25E9D0|nr:DUF6691 family protein [Suttonella sp. R2A3]UJF23958.1 YeeE/YedE family protein [Suttonella sp. R2A3]